MKQKAFVLQNKGMNRDTSISKVGESSAYENHNIRILARDHDTLLSVTNERGNKYCVLNGLANDNLRVTEDEDFRLTEDELFRTVGESVDENLYDFAGILVGWNVLNNHVVLFTHEGETDRIYRVDYDGAEFYNTLLFRGNLRFDLAFPIESVTYYETKDIQKIYWVDGKNVLRFMNFAALPDETTGLLPWQIDESTYDETYFDSNRSVDFGIDVDITKSNSGNTRPNGVVQYLVTYYNKHGQESGYVWVSDLVYLSPVGVGGAADGTNNNSVTLKVGGLDTRFDHFRVYSVFRSSLNGTTVSYIVYEGETSDDDILVTDDGAHLTDVDSSALLYLGSQAVRAGTLTHKDQTLFLGDLQSIGKENYDELEQVIRDTMFDQNDHVTSTCITFQRSVTDDDVIGDIPSEEDQLKYTSSQILSFKGGEKYRFALSFKREDGTSTEAFWIGDKTNTIYPSGLKRIVAKCELPSAIVFKMKKFGFKTATLMIAEATYADRSVKAQGVVNPTVFNVWDRYNDKLYASASWMSRPRRSDFAWKHFEVIRNSTYSTGEIECNYWTTTAFPQPYYRLKDYSTSDKTYDGDFDGVKDFDCYLILYGIYCYREFFINHYSGNVTIMTAKLKSGGSISDLDSYVFGDAGNVDLTTLLATDRPSVEKEFETEDFTINIYHQKWNYGILAGNPGKDNVYNIQIEEIQSRLGRDNIVVPNLSDPVYYQWCDEASENRNKTCYFNYVHSTNSYIPTTQADYLDALQDAANAGGWYTYGEAVTVNNEKYIPSYYKKHLMFVDENVVTLNSPEFDYEVASLDNVDGCKFRIVGVAKVVETNTDYTVDATPGKLAGENLIKEKFSRAFGLTSWPMWKEYGLTERKLDEEGEEFEHTVTDYPSQEWTSDDYLWGGGIVYYWLHMWHHAGSITTFNGGLVRDDEKYSFLHRKVFANERYCSSTVYHTYGTNPNCDYVPDSVRMFNYTSSQYVRLNIGGRTRYYDAIVQESLGLPATHKYPILYSNNLQSTDKYIHEANAFLYSNTPIQIEYASSPHAVIALHTEPSKDADSRTWYEQDVLPSLNGLSVETIATVGTTGSLTGALIPWEDTSLSAAYPYKNYRVNQQSFSLPDSGIVGMSKYFYIGELYYPYGDGVEDTRYGGTTDAAIQNCRFIPAGPQYLVDDMNADGNDVMYANQGDTYFQRWECLKTKPYSTGAVNNVIDVTSVVLETHINVEGRTDQQRKSNYLASIDTEKFNSLNPVYTQHNNFVVQHDLDEDFNLDSYRSSITWSLEKHDLADVDEWSHVTLASTLKLDGDKGWCRALRRFGNTIIAFQDRAISEILFNSRTQLSTQDGVPVEIANSGKVDGKRYITNKYGCLNKWSITEGKNALYFVDNINKAFCAFSGQAIDNLSTKLGFSVWFRDANNMNPWNPNEFNNIVSYYDRVHSDIYLMRNTDDEMPCLVYNENLGAFTSFFDYRAVLMMVNVEDRFLSYKRHALWLQNEGLYGNFFGRQYGFWTQYRVTPDPFGDKIWTNIDYRADFYEVLDENGTSVIPEEYLVNGDSFGELSDTYKEWETLTDYKVWDEYQTTGFVPLTHEHFDRDDVRKKFRIWRLAIPRALKEGTNKYGMDRIRNPWINILFRKQDPDGKNLVQLHDFVVKYFE